MPLPSGGEYTDAVQNPRIAFNDFELKACAPETDQFGIPKPYSGGFTTTFHLTNHSQEWAARCFTRAIPDLQKRYEAIGRFSQNISDPFFVKANCLPKGIIIGGHWHPIIKMQWIKGSTLGAFIQDNLSNSVRLKTINDSFISLVRRLEQLGIAHGDLQHGNIIVSGSNLVLIDYDGIYLPLLSTLKSSEIGHPNYQHPARNANHYGPSIDRFSSIVIYLGLQALSTSPQLWNKFGDDDRILLSQNDFDDPDSSPLLSDLAAFPSLIELVNRFRGVCKLPFDKIPSIDQFIQGGFVYPKVKQKPPTPSQTATWYSDRRNINAILTEPVSTKKISNAHKSKSNYGVILLLLLLAFIVVLILSLNNRQDSTSIMPPYNPVNTPHQENNNVDPVETIKPNAKVIGNSVSLRSSLDPDASVLTTLAAGAGVFILKEEKLGTEDDARLTQDANILTSSGQKSLLSGAHLSIVGEKNDDFLVSFDDRGTEAIGQIPKTFIEKIPPSSWLLIRTVDGIEGWVKLEDINPTNQR